MKMLSTFVSYRGVHKCLFLRASVFGRRATLKMWNCVEPNFYRTGAFVAFGVKAWPDTVPPFAHRVRLKYYKRKAQKRVKEICERKANNLGK